jgi:hypothetical protein
LIRPPEFQGLGTRLAEVPSPPRLLVAHRKAGSGYMPN